MAKRRLLSAGALVAALLLSIAAAPETPVRPNWADRIVVVEIEGTIMPALFGSGGIAEDIKRIFDQIDRDRPRQVIVEVNSLGGAVITCKTIADTILDCPVPTTALVREDAISGGAMISVACDTIDMLEGSRIGDVQPMTMMGEGMDERTAEKSETYVRSVMSAAADANGHPKALLNAMVSRDIELYRITFSDETAAFLTAGEVTLLEEEIEAGRDEREIARKKLIVETGKLLTLTAHEAVDYGLAAGVYDSRDAFLAARDFPRADIVYPHVPTGRGTMKIWTQLLVAVFLIVGITGAFAEMSMPGFGIPGACGIIGFAGFFLLLFFHGRADWISLTLFFLGIALLVVEIAVIPGFGVAGGLGILLLLAGLVLAILPGLQSPEWSYNWWEELSSVVLIFGASIVGVILLLWVAITLGDRVPGVNQFYMRESLRSGREVLADVLAPGGGDPAEDAEPLTPDPRACLRGKTAVATTPLHPAGKARLEETGELLDVVAQSGLIEEKSRVVVLDTSMNRILVAPLGEPSGETTGQA